MSEERGWWREERASLEDQLTAEEMRVLGCLMEKEAATPEYYPLTLNALVTACNQTSNRDPVVAYDPATVTDALDQLRARKLTRIVHSPSGRAPKYKHVVDEALALDAPARAVLTVLLLRGPQTLGELRTRTERLHPFDSTAEVEAVLEALASGDQPLTTRMERQPGQKEARYAHQLGGPPVMPATGPGDWNPPSSSPSTAGSAGPTAARLAALEEQLSALTEEVAELRNAHEDLKRQLGA